MRRLLVILDGLGDHADPAGAEPTPLEAAATPHLDRLAQDGALGLVEVVGPGIAPESDAGALALLGVDPRSESPGRGVLEALGAGIDLAPGDLALRLNFATSDGAGTILDARVGRTLSTAEAGTLAKALTVADLLAEESVRAEVRSTVGHRGVLWLHPTDGRTLSPNVSNSDPFYERIGGAGQARAGAEPHLRPVEPLDASPEAARSARLIDRFVAQAPGVLAAQAVNGRRALAGRPIANAVLVRSAGTVPPVPTRSFRDRTGLSGAAITEMPVERGIARWLGLSDRYLGPMGPDRDRALRERAAAVLEELGRHDFVYVHLKGPDEPGHDGQREAKREVIEALDRSFFGPLLGALDLPSVRLAVTADHATPWRTRGHSDDPVPLVLAGGPMASSGGRADRKARKFGEAEAAHGELGTLRGVDLLGRLLADGPPA